MPQEYSSKLTLKDNFTAVIGKAMQATEQLRAKLQSMEKQVAALSNKKIKIGAQLDSSVRTTMNRLSSSIPANRTISLKARDEVTRTVTNLQRDIYRMNREIGMGMRDPFRGLNTSSLAAIRNMAAMRTAMTALTAGSAIRGLVGAQAAGILPALVGGAAAGRVARGMAAGRTASMAGMILSPNGLITDPRRNQREGLGTSPYGAGSVRTIPTRSGGLRIAGNYASMGAVFGTQRLDTRTLDNFMGRGSTYRGVKAVGGDDYFRLIQNQRRYMSQTYGNLGSLQNFIPKRNTNMANVTRPDGTRVRAGMNTVFEQMNILDRNAGRIANSFRPIFRGITGGINSGFQAVRSNVSSIWNSPLLRRGRQAVTESIFAGQRGLLSMRGLGSVLGNRAMVISARLQDFGARTGLTGILTAARGIAGKTFGFTVNAITSGARAAIAGLMTAIKGLSVAAGAIVIGGATMGIKGAMENEQNIVSIEHFIKYANTKKVSEGKAPQMSDADIKKAASDYMGGMRKYADDTSFATNDVMSAGRRAVNVMNGDLGKADELVKIAGDMAALNPGKTIMDAMEALADMKTGEMERMKEFGLKISAEQFKGLVGKGKNDDLTDDEMAKAYQMTMDQKLKTMFGGGAKKMGETALGKWSTLTGSAGSALTDIGTMFLPGIKTGLDKAINMINGAGPRFIAAFKPIADGFNKFMSGEGGGGGKFAAMFQQISTSLQPAIQAFTTLFTKVDFVQYFANVVAVAGSAIKLVMEMLGPVFNVAGVIIADVMTFIGGHIVDVQNIFKDLSMIWASSWPVLSSILLGAWNVIKPAMEALWNIAMVIVDVFTLAWPLIAGAVQVLWAVISPIFSGISLLLEGIAWAAGLAHKALQFVIDKKAQLGGSTDINVNSNSTSNDGYSERAIGMDYIPYNGYKISAHRGEQLLTRAEADEYRAGKSGGGGGIVINLHDAIIREESDINRLGTMLANALSQVHGNMGGVPAIG